jgi:hypothetical protein
MRRRHMQISTSNTDFILSSSKISRMEGHRRKESEMEINER